MLYDLKHNPASRRILTNLYNFADLSEMALYPCAYSMTFNVSGNTLNAILNQRSQDMLAANNWNVCQYAVLVHMFAQVSGLVPGELVHVIADAHIYDRHVPVVEEILRNTPQPAPTFRVDPAVTDFYAFTRTVSPWKITGTATSPAISPWLCEARRFPQEGDAPLRLSSKRRREGPQKAFGEFAAVGREQSWIRFSRRHVRREKHISRSARGLCTPLACKVCAKRSVVPFLKEGYTFFEKVKASPPCGDGGALVWLLGAFLQAMADHAHHHVVEAGAVLPGKVVHGVDEALRQVHCFVPGFHLVLRGLWDKGQGASSPLPHIVKYARNF